MLSALSHIVQPTWPAPANIVAGVTTRLPPTLNTNSNVHKKSDDSACDYAAFNLASHVGDELFQVLNNRQQLDKVLQQALAATTPNKTKPPANNIDSQLHWQWLEQTHSTEVLCFGSQAQGSGADAIYSRSDNEVCAVLTADCLPILLCDHAGEQVAAVHAGWRGLARGIVANAVQCFVSEGIAASKLYAWLGPAIGPERFEVGPEVVEAFRVAMQPDDNNTNSAEQALALEQAFRPSGQSGHFLADLYQLARIALRQCGVHHIYGGGFCTYNDSERFYSYRRDNQTGRQASFIFRHSCHSCRG